MGITLADQKYSAFMKKQKPNLGNACYQYRIFCLLFYK